MKTFNQAVTSEWVEILQGGTVLAFDVLEAAAIEVYFSESADVPTGDGNKVYSWGDNWDFELSGMEHVKQRVWIKGSGNIRGVRG